MGDMVSLARTLKYYKRPEVQEAIARHAQDREISPRYGDGFGKRPDAIAYPQDVLEFAKRKATSFHCSEERWENPLAIQTGMSRKDQNDLRIGWDLVLDIDAKDWEISRLTAWLFIQALRAHNIESISTKFSGNKGWHIGVPWEAFPDTILDEKDTDVPTKELFPELPRAIAQYLVEYIAEHLVKIDKDEVVFGGKIKSNLNELAKKAGKTKKDLIGQYDPATRRFVAKDYGMFGLWCQSCGFRKRDRLTQEQVDVLPDKERSCPKCGSWMDAYPLSRDGGTTKKNLQPRLKIDAIIEFDTVLLASRHLYRMPYSLHEKSGLASVVVDPDDVLSFKKEDASPDTITFDRTFLEPGKSGEAAKLVSEARSRTTVQETPSREFEVPEEATPEKLFPPCMQHILSGLKDGRKRALFALVNFLRVNGWSNDMIEERVYEWNEENAEPLRETEIKSHLRGKAKMKEKIPPPNCKAFYQELGVCHPDQTCQTIKNPAQYGVKLVKIGKHK